MSNPAHDPFYASPFGPFYRRHAPYAMQPEYRIYELNKRLQSRTEVSFSAPRARRVPWKSWTVPRSRIGAFISLLTFFVPLVHATFDVHAGFTSTRVL